MIRAPERAACMLVVYIHVSTRPRTHSHIDGHIRERLATLLEVISSDGGLEKVIQAAVDRAR